MINQHAFTTVFSALFSEWGWAVALGCILGGVSALIAVAACKLLERFRDSAVQHALLAEYEQQCETQRLAREALEEKQCALACDLHHLWDDVNSLAYALHGTTRQLQDALWASRQQLGKPMPVLTLPESHRPFYTELTALTHALLHLGAQLDSARVEWTDLEFYRAWVKDLRERFRSFQLKNKHDRQYVRQKLAEIQELHGLIGQCWEQTKFNPFYQRIPGKIFILETLLDGNLIAAKELLPSIESLTSELEFLMSCYKEDESYMSIL